LLFHPESNGSGTSDEFEAQREVEPATTDVERSVGPEPVFELHRGNRSTNNEEAVPHSGASALERPPTGLLPEAELDSFREGTPIRRTPND
jgi:hypothetical protein